MIKATKDGPNHYIVNAEQLATELKKILLKVCDSDKRVLNVYIRNCSGIERISLLKETIIKLNKIWKSAK